MLRLVHLTRLLVGFGVAGLWRHARRLRRFLLASIILIDGLEELLGGLYLCVYVDFVIRLNQRRLSRLLGLGNGALPGRIPQRALVGRILRCEDLSFLLGHALAEGVAICLRAHIGRHTALPLLLLLDGELFLIVGVVHVALGHA